jgi:hypothetical protein
MSSDEFLFYAGSGSLEESLNQNWAFSLAGIIPNDLMLVKDRLIIIYKFIQ